MRRTIYSVFAVFCILFTNITAFAEASHILVFRHSGSIESFEVSKLSSIELSELDQEGNTHDHPVSQIFRIGEESRLIPIADIDSVIFGDRNHVVARPGTRRILDSELPFIINYNGNSLVYSAAAPTSVIPNVGEKIYYDNFCETFPFGLCGEIIGRVQTSNGYELNVNHIEPAEIFDEYIITGDFDYVPMDNDTRADFDGGFDHEFDLKTGPVHIESEWKGGLSFKNVVCSPVRNYYSADIYLINKANFDINIHSDDSAEINLESKPITVAKGIVAGVLQPQLDFNLFCDIEAMLSFGIKLNRTSSLHYHWEKKKDENTFELINDRNSETDEDLNSNTFTLDILLEGTLHLGAQADLSLNTLFNRAGVGIKAKIGPEFTGEFGIGTVNDMSIEYDPDLFIKANITSAMAIKTETYAYHRKNIVTGEIVETPLPFKSEIRFLERTFNLLPEFHSKAVRINGIANHTAPSIQERMIDMASISEGSIAKDLEMGFRLTDINSGETIAETQPKFVISSQTMEAQGFNERLPYSGDIANVEVSPIIKYADKYILCQPTAPIEGAAINGIFASGVTNAWFGIGGAPVIGEKTGDNTTLIIGNIMPIAGISRNPVFNKNKRTFKTVSFIDENGKTSGSSDNSLFGEWEGNFNDERISLTLSASDADSSYNGESCSATYNYPQTGVVALSFAENRNILLRVAEITSDSLTVYFGNNAESVTLNRIR